MKKNIIISLCLTNILLFVLGCSDKEQLKEVPLDSKFIEFNFTDGQVLKNNSVLININEPAEILELKIFVDNNLKKIFNSTPYNYTFSNSEFEDGSHNLKVLVKLVGGSITQKSISFKIDKNGPFLSNLNLSNDQVFCDLFTIESSVEDVVSNITKTQLYLDNNLVHESIDNTKVIFDINPEDYNAGNHNLKFVLEDAVGNTTQEEYNIKIGKTVISLKYPSNFVRVSAEKLYVVLSDNDGNYLDSKQYNNQASIITFCSPEIISNNQKFMLTFFEVFDNSLYNVFNYSGLTKNNLGDLITFKNRPLTVNHAFVNIDASNLSPNGLPWASGTGYSIITNSSGKFSGTITTDFGDGNLGTNKTFIKRILFKNIVNNAVDSYEWAYIEDIQNLNILNDSDFSSDNIFSQNYSFNTSPLHKLTKIYGYENENLRSAFSGHDVFSDSANTTFRNHSISFADIFDSYFYSIKGRNYYLEGNGIPPLNINIPGSSISFNKSGNRINFQGIQNYEVGKIELEKQEANLSIRLTFIFDGSRNNVVIPKIPEGIFHGDVHNIFNNANFTELQAVSENYEGYTTFDDYLREVFINSKPFILTSNSRERVFKSNVSTQISPIYEYPYWERF